MIAKLIFVAAATVLMFAALSTVPVGQRTLGVQQGHTLLHLNCPPGSHGKPRTDGVGRQLQQARDEARAARSINERAITAR